jgi:hypothetical protein
MTDGTTPPGHASSPPAPAPADPAGPAYPASPADSASTSEIVRLSLAGLSGTGDTRVDEAVAQLGQLDDAPLEEHPVILGQVHDRLREVLGELSPDDNQRATGAP